VIALDVEGIKKEKWKRMESLEKWLLYADYDAIVNDCLKNNSYLWGKNLNLVVFETKRFSNWIIWNGRWNGINIIRNIIFFMWNFKGFS